MSLTLGEKAHWRERIAKRIDQRIETLVAKEDPLLPQRVAEQARAKAHESLGIGGRQRISKRWKRALDWLRTRLPAVEEPPG